MTALSAMTAEATELGYHVVSLGGERYEEPDVLIKEILAAAAPHTVILGGGEPRMVITHGGGNGGRNEYLSARMIGPIMKHAVFVSFASDGMDNQSEAAGGIVDATLQEKAATLPASIESYLQEYKHDELLEALGARIIVGPTEANVSDLFFLITE